eukprot:gene1109-1663_t
MSATEGEKRVGEVSAGIGHVNQLVKENFDQRLATLSTWLLWIQTTGSSVASAASENGAAEMSTSSAFMTTRSDKDYMRRPRSGSNSSRSYPAEDKTNSSSMSTFDTLWSTLAQAEYTLPQ